MCTTAQAMCHSVGRLLGSHTCIGWQSSTTWCGLLAETFTAFVRRSLCFRTMAKSINESGTQKSVSRSAKKCSQNALVLT